MSRRRVFWQLGLLATSLASACVRMDEPPAFGCESDRDCERGERCSVNLCVANTCTEHRHCGSDLACVAGQCEPAECSSSVDFCDGPYACDLDNRRCRTSCTQDHHCLGATCLAGVCE